MAFEQDGLENQWKKVLDYVSNSFGEVEDLKDVVFLIGVQELGLGFRNFSKDEKVDVMHIGVCCLLGQYGYYEILGRDEDGWPHWQATVSLPELTDNDRELLLKRAIIKYFEE